MKGDSSEEKFSSLSDKLKETKKRFGVEVKKNCDLQREINALQKAAEVARNNEREAIAEADNLSVKVREMEEKLLDKEKLLMEMRKKFDFEEKKRDGMEEEAKALKLDLETMEAMLKEWSDKYMMDKTDGDISYDWNGSVSDLMWNNLNKNNASFSSPKAVSTPFIRNFR